MLEWTYKSIKRDDELSTSERQGDCLEFLYGLGIILVIGFLILLPTVFRKITKRPEDDLDRFFTNAEEQNKVERKKHNNN